MDNKPEKIKIILIKNYHDILNTVLIKVKTRLHAKNLPINVVMQIHDELVLEVPKNEYKKYAKIINDMVKEESDLLLGDKNVCDL